MINGIVITCSPATKHNKKRYRVVGTNAEDWNAAARALSDGERIVNFVKLDLADPNVRALATMLDTGPEASGVEKVLLELFTTGRTEGAMGVHEQLFK